MTQPLRVAQWATGNIGTRALRQVIAHPQLELAGVLVYDSAKDGVDAGVLCGGEPMGVLATTDPQSLRDLRADCVLYMPRFLDLDDVVGLLSSGSNVVTTRSEFFGRGAGLTDADRQRVVDACRTGGSSILATGSSPGFISDALPLTLLSLQRRADGVEIDEYADLSQRDSPELLFDLMGFGQLVQAVDDARATYLLGEFRPSLADLADATGRAVTRWTAVGEVAGARADTRIAAGVIPAGTVAAQRTTLSGHGEAGIVVRFSANWYCTTAIEPAWELRPTGWRVQVRGDAPLDVRVDFPVAPEDLADFTPGLTANRPVNAVPYVCAAAPGILSVRDLPLISYAGPP